MCISFLALPSNYVPLEFTPLSPVVTFTAPFRPSYPECDPTTLFHPSFPSLLPRPPLRHSEGSLTTFPEGSWGLKHPSTLASVDRMPFLETKTNFPLLLEVSILNPLPLLLLSSPPFIFCRRDSFSILILIHRKTHQNNK